MYSLILFIHIVVSLGLILVVLLQKGRGTDISSIFGGGGQNPFMSSRGTASFVSKLTVSFAAIFMVTSLYLSIKSGKQSSSSSLLEKTVEEETLKTKTGRPVPPIGDTSGNGSSPLMPMSITPLNGEKSN